MGKVRQQQVCHQTSVPTIAIREGVNCHKPVVKSNGYLIWGIYLFLDPEKNIAT